VLDLEVETDRDTIRLDHFCPGASSHRLLAVELTPRELERLAAGEAVLVPVSCDRCLWERRLVVRAPGTAP
jgi:hypothetical protein